MKTLNFDPSTLNAIVYEIQKIEQEFQHAKDTFEVIDDSSKDVLAQIKNKISSEMDIAEVKAETLARGTQEWKDYKSGLYEAKKKYGQMSVKYKHLLRVMECVIEGMRYNSKLLMKNVHDIGGK